VARKTVLIIGAGIAGLSTGCYAQMNEYDSEIFEMHDKPGGLCTSWKRGGYTVDGCIHHLAGSNPRSELYRVWNELGAMQDRRMVFYDEIVQVEAGGRTLTVYSDIDRLEQHLKETSPRDFRVIDEYVKAARQFTRIDLLSVPLLTPFEMVAKTLPMLGTVAKWGKVTLEQFAERFADPFLRRAFPTVQYDFRGVPMVVHLTFLAGSHNKTLGWPEGGSLEFARAIEKHYLNLGGKVHYRSRVSEVLVEDNRVVGIRLSDGTERRADVVVSAADGHSTVFDLLKGRYVDHRISRYFHAPPDYCEMNLQVSLGVARDMSQEPHSLTWFLEEPLNVADRTVDRLDIEVFNFDPTLAPAGKTVVKVMFGTKYSYWKGLSADRARYEGEKRSIAEAVIGRLEGRFPGIKSQIEMVDVATAMTLERFTGNYHGLQAWLPPGAGLTAISGGFMRTLPNLTNFYMAGQWAEAMIGVSTAAVSGRKTVQRLCKEDGKRFTAKSD